MGTGRSIPSPTNLTMHTKPIVPLSCRTCAPPRKSRLARSYSRTPAQRGRRSRFARRAPKVGSPPASAASPTSHYHQCHLQLKRAGHRHRRRIRRRPYHPTSPYLRGAHRQRGAHSRVEVSGCCTGPRGSSCPHVMGVGDSEPLHLTWVTCQK